MPLTVSPNAFSALATTDAAVVLLVSNEETFGR